MLWRVQAGLWLVERLFSLNCQVKLVRSNRSHCQIACTALPHLTDLIIETIVIDTALCSHLSNASDLRFLSLTAQMTIT